MFTNFTAEAAAEHQHALRIEADQARLARVARAARRTKSQPVTTPHAHRVATWRRSFRPA